MKKNVQRILATILTVIMMISMLPSNVFAADFDADMFVEPAVEAVSVPAEEQEVESTVEYIYEEPAETLQGSSDEIQTVEAADPAADEIEEETEAPVVDGTVTLKAEGSDYTVTVTYDVSAGLPADADIRVKEVMEKNKKYDDYVAQAADTIASDVESLNYVRLFDITLVDAAGNELEPDNSVDVQIQLKDVVEVQDTTQVVHFAGEEEIPEVIESTVEDDTIVFSTDGFSIYAVVESGNFARLTVNFEVESDITTMYVKKKDITDGNLNQVLYDPGAPFEENKQFLGWTDDPNWQNRTVDELKTAAMTIDGVREAVTTTLNNSIIDGASVTYYAVMVNSFKLFYQDEYENTYRTENVLSTGTTATTTVDQDYELIGGTSTQNFIGWKVKDSTDEVVYANGETITISADTILEPAIGEGMWLFFDANAGGAGVSEASYTAPQFIASGKTARQPANPTRPGYIFAGWYVGAGDDAAAFDFSKTMDQYTPEADGYVHAYAHWTANPTASYKVVIWAQKVTDDKDAADTDKTYDYVGTFTINDAIAGTPLTEEELGQSSNKYFEKDNEYFGATDLENGSTAFEYNRFEVKNGIGTAQNGVSPDNSTVVNVYYDRALMTIAFTASATTDSGSLPQEVYYYATNDTSGTIYGRVNGNYVRLTRRAAGKRVEWGKYTSGTPTYYDPAPQYIWTNRTSAVKNSTNDRYSVSAVEQANASTINNASVGTSFTRINTSTMVFQTGSQGSQFYARVGSSAELAACYVLQNYAFTVTDSGEEYTGTIYKQATRQGMTGLYGQSLSKYNYSWPTPSAGGTWDGVSYLDAFTGSFFGAEYFGGAPNVIELDRDTEQTNLTVVYYLQDKDDPDKYNRIDSVRYPLDTTAGGKFKLTERILGGTSKDYAWSASDSIPAEGSSWHTEKDSGGRTEYTREEAGNGNQNSITHLHIRYSRETHDIIYMQGTNILKTVSGVPYEASLADYAGTLPEDKVTIPEGEFFSGWFEDPEGVKRVDWDGTMPLGNKIIYAVVRKAQYHVVIDMDGGTLPNNQSTEFWEDAGRIIDDTNFKNATKTDAQGNVYRLVGYYWDEALSKPWNFAVPLSEDYLWYKYDDTLGENGDPARNSDFFAPDHSDVGWPRVVGIFRLWAKWVIDDILSKGGLHIKYVNEDGTTLLYEDSKKYADDVDVIAAQAPTEDYWPDEMRFDGWKLKEGEVYQPGDVFVASSSDANFVNNQYTITLTATYVEKEDRTPTHITWYKNYDDKTGNPSYAESPNLGINEAWPIYGAADSGYPVPTREGHTFLGWAKATEKEDEGDTPNTIINVTEDDYFLDYKNGKFYVHGTDNEAEAVAADEVLPYDGLYAIWKDEQIHIYHSSDGATEVSIPEKDGDTLKKVDLTGYVKSGYIYGGYYEYDKDDTGDPIHRGTAITSEPGTAVTPEAGKWYYLKEVDPTKYLLPNIYVTWLKAASRELRNFYVLADTDEAQYQNIGVYVDVVDKDGNKKERETYGLTSGFYDKLTVTQSGSTLGEYTTKNIFGYEGVFGMSMKADAQKYAIDHTLKDAEITLTAYYTTLDGVLVTGTTQKKYNLGDQTCQSWAAPGIRAVATGTATPTYGAVLESAGSPAMAYRGTYQLKSEPEISKYTVTKIDNGKTVTQEVQAGDNTGKITYSGKTGYVFAGWYLDKSYKKKADFSAVAGNMTVYAKYVKTSAIGLSFTKKSSKSGSVILNATLKITGAPDITDVAVDCGYNGKASAVKFTGVKTTKSGKTTINTYTGTVTISGLANKKSFTVAISYRTPDGTTVNLADKTCKYVSGSVTVK